MSLFTLSQYLAEREKTRNTPEEKRPPPRTYGWMRASEPGALAVLGASARINNDRAQLMALKEQRVEYDEAVRTPEGRRMRECLWYIDFLLIEHARTLTDGALHVAHYVRFTTQAKQGDGRLVGEGGGSYGVLNHYEEHVQMSSFSIVERQAIFDSLEKRGWTVNVSHNKQKVTLIIRIPPMEPTRPAAR